MRPLPEPVRERPYRPFQSELPCSGVNLPEWVARCAMVGARVPRWRSTRRQPTAPTASRSSTTCSRRRPGSGSVARFALAGAAHPHQADGLADTLEAADAGLRPVVLALRGVMHLVGGEHAARACVSRHAAGEVDRPPVPVPGTAEGLAAGQTNT